MDLECALLAVDCLQDVVELGDERPKGTRSNDEKEDAVHLGPPQERAQSHDTQPREHANIPPDTHRKCRRHRDRGRSYSTGVLK